jgi:hypothetical protein
LAFAALPVVVVAVIEVEAAESLQDMELFVAVHVFSEGYDA